MSKGITLDEHIDATYNVVKANKGENPFKVRSFSDEELAEWLTNMCDFINPEDEEPYK